MESLPLAETWGPDGAHPQITERAGDPDGLDDNALATTAFREVFGSLHLHI